MGLTRIIRPDSGSGRLGERLVVKPAVVDHTALLTDYRRS